MNAGWAAASGSASTSPKPGFRRPCTVPGPWACWGLAHGVKCWRPQGLSAIHLLLLDVTDPERVRRLRARGDEHATQDMLNWAAWLRVYQVLAAWAPHVLTDGAWEEMRWPRWQALDTTGLTPEQTAQRVQVWLNAQPGLAEIHGE